ncbi:MAG: lipid-A-disaccharide synthase [Chitinophagales bacterium]
MKYYIIAGEASGDLHGSNLMKALRRKDAEADFRCWGGDLMEASGGNLVKHYRNLAFMGFVTVLLNLRTILGNIRFCKEDILAYQPDVLILIDYPGFNLRIAEFAHKASIPIVYYISPQVWAWHSSRVPKMMEVIDKMMVILPFEKDYFAEKWNWEVDFVGHPLLDVVAQKQAAFNDLQPTDLGLTSNKPIIALLPGSRQQEISIVLPQMLSVIDRFPQYQFVIAGAPSLGHSFYETFTWGKNVQVVSNQTYLLLHLAEAALVTSGTATLETALFGVPQVVCYKGNWISYWIAKRLVDVPFISLVNLVSEKEVVKELIQGDLNPKNLQTELQKILPNGSRYLSIKKEYEQLYEKLGREGASDEAARLVLEVV